METAQSVLRWSSQLVVQPCFRPLPVRKCQYNQAEEAGRRQPQVQAQCRASCVISLSESVAVGMVDTVAWVADMVGVADTIVAEGGLVAATVEVNPRRYFVVAVLAVNIVDTGLVVASFNPLLAC